MPGSCEEYRQMGSFVDGERLIQPSRDLEPFNVECKFVNGTASTIIKKTHENNSGFTSIPDTDGCSSAGCFSDVITYEPSMSQIEVRPRPGLNRLHFFPGINKSERPL